MSQAELISQQILASLKKRNLPAYMRYTEAAGNVVLDFSRDVGYATYEYFDSESREANRSETVRLLEVLKKGNLKQMLERVTRTVVNEFMAEAPERLIDSLPGLLGNMTGKTFVNKVLMQDIASILADTLIPRILMNTTFSTAVMLGGARARSIYASRRLFRESPRIYYLLRDGGDLDLLYFIAEDYLEPFIKAVSISKKDKKEFEKIFVNVMNGLKK